MDKIVDDEDVFITCIYSLAVMTNSWYTIWSAVNPIPKRAEVGCKWAGIPEIEKSLKMGNIEWYRVSQQVLDEKF